MSDFSPLSGRLTLDRKTQRMIEAHDKGFEAWWQASSLGAMRASDDERQERARRREANQHGRLCGKCGKAIKADEPIARVPVKTEVLFGCGEPLVVQCLKCAESHFRFDRRWARRAATPAGARCTSATAATAPAPSAATVAAGRAGGTPRQEPHHNCPI
jgi:hypothetical protein